MKIEVRRSLLNPSRLDAGVVGPAKGGGLGCIDDAETRLVVGIGNAAYRSELESSLAEFPGAPVGVILDWRLEAPGSLVVIDKYNLTIDIAVDLLGCFPIFVQRLPDAVCLSDQVSELVTGAEDIDAAAVTEFLRFGYCVGTGTPFRQIRRARPGEFIRFDFGSGTARHEDRSTLWGTHLELTPATALEVFCEKLEVATRYQEPVRLMMSGGWDSRLLLAACLASGGSVRPALYFHGDIESREAGLVRRIQASENLDAEFVEITPGMFTPERLAEHFIHFESASFPFWHAARANRPHGAGAVMAGIFGEVVGGHYGPPMALSGRKKITESLAWLLTPSLAGRSANDTDGLAQARQMYRQRPYAAPWYMHRDAWQDLFSTIHLDVEQGIQAALDRYHERGALATHALIEAFITEHRGSQFIAAQLHSAAGAGGFAAPYANRSLIELAASVPFQSKAFNRFTQAAIRRLWPALLQFPMAATLCKGGRPVAMLEASRGVRKLLEGHVARSALRRLRNQRNPLKLSWVNFGAISDSGVLDDIVDSLSSPFWNKAAMHSAVGGVAPERSHPLTDMLLKIKTMDLLLRPVH